MSYSPPTTKVVYKLVRDFGENSLTERTFFSLSPKFQMIYRFHRLSFPLVTGNPFLFVFETLGQAEHFCKEYGLHKSSDVVIVCGIALNPRKRANLKGGSIITTKKFPRGTLFCDAFLPLEKV